MNDDIQDQTKMLVYLYLYNTPVSNVDPTGKWFVATVIGAITGAIVGAAVAAINGQDVITGLAIGAIIGGLTGAAIDTLGGSALAMTAFGIGFVGDIATQVFLEGEDLMEINLIQSVNAGLVNMTYGMISKGLDGGMKDFTKFERGFTTAIYEFNAGGLGIAAGTGLIGGLAGNAVSQQLSYGNIEPAPLVYSGISNMITNSFAYMGLKGTGLFDGSLKWNFEEVITPSAYALGATSFVAFLPNLNPNSLRSEYQNQPDSDENSQNQSWSVLYEG